MSEPDYGPPVDRLLKIPDDLRKVEDWHDYAGMGLTLADVPELLRMAVDHRWDELDVADHPEVWAPIHAWRALGTLRAEAAIPTLIGLLEANRDAIDFDDWITEDIPEVLGMIGPAALPGLTGLLEREAADGVEVSDAPRTLAEVAQRHPETRDEVVATLVRALGRGADNDITFNGFLISSLIDLEAREAAGAIERAHADDVVDDSVCGTWFDVWHRLKLEGEPPPKTERKYILGPRFDPNPLPADRRPPDHRKERNKARKKLEKQARKKRRKKR